MRRILIITGPGGDAQGWGNLEVTEKLCETLNHGDKRAEMVYVETEADFYRAIEQKSFDIIWSALYHISERKTSWGWVRMRICGSRIYWTPEACPISVRTR